MVVETAEVNQLDRVRKISHSSSLPGMDSKMVSRCFLWNYKMISHFLGFKTHIPFLRVLFIFAV